MAKHRVKVDHVEAHFLRNALRQIVRRHRVDGLHTPQRRR